MEELTYKNIDRARKILGLNKEVTLSEIRSAYKKLSIKYHPDRCDDENKKECEKKFKEISLAYKLIKRYCDIHKFSFTKEKVEEISPHEAYRKHMERFYDDWR